VLTDNRILEFAVGIFEELGGEPTFTETGLLISSKEFPSALELPERRRLRLVRDDAPGIESVSFSAEVTVVEFSGKTSWSTAWTTPSLINILENVSGSFSIRISAICKAGSNTCGSFDDKTPAKKLYDQSSNA
jgi:hypothetical protein